MDLNKEIEKVKDLEQDYRRKRMVTGSLKSSDAFHAWHRAMLILFNKFVPADNEDFQFIKNQDASGNEYVLSSVYDVISGRYSMLMDGLENGMFSASCANRATSCVERQLVFVSHASADKKIIKEFVDKILKEGLGLRDENIAFTSCEATGVTPGDNIPEFIKDNIGAAKIVLSMVSEAYKASAVCQNEVGAAWALGKKPVQILLQDVDFDELGWLFSLNKAGRIDNQEYLDHLEEILCNKLGLALVSPRHWNPCVKSFLESYHSNSLGSAEIEVEKIYQLM